MNACSEAASFFFNPLKQSMLTVPSAAKQRFCIFWHSGKTRQRMFSKRNTQKLWLSTCWDRGWGKSRSLSAREARKSERSRQRGYRKGKNILSRLIIESQFGIKTPSWFCITSFSSCVPAPSISMLFLARSESKSNCMKVNFGNSEMPHVENTLKNVSDSWESIAREIIVQSICLLCWGDAVKVTTAFEQESFSFYYLS